MTVLSDATVAVCLKRRLPADDDRLDDEGPTLTPSEIRRRDLLTRIDATTTDLGSDAAIDDLIQDGLVQVSYAEDGNNGFVETSGLTPQGRAWLDAHQ